MVHMHVIRREYPLAPANPPDDGKGNIDQRHSERQSRNYEGEDSFFAVALDRNQGERKADEIGTRVTEKAPGRRKIVGQEPDQGAQDTQTDDNADDRCLASMGIYVFNRETLLDLLERNPDSTDFGKEIIPKMCRGFVHDIS